MKSAENDQAKPKEIAPDLLLGYSNESLADVIGQQSEIITSQKSRIAILEETLRLERARIFGRSSEKNPDQGEMFNEIEHEANADLESDDEITIVSKKKSGGRKGLSKDLPRVQLHIKLSDEEKVGAVSTFFVLVKEELDIQPAKVQVIEHHQEKAVFIKDGQREIKSAKLPKHPLGKCIASVSLLAYIIAAKYCDGLPLYRLEKIIARYGGEISRTSMANWMMRIALQLQPLINLMREHQLSYDYIALDETRLQVLKEAGGTPSSDRWLWVAKGGPPDKPSVIFDYDPSRSKAVPLRLYDTFAGYCQVDGYAGYNALCDKDGINRVGCWDHCRRKFTEAKKAAPKKQKRGVVAKYDIALQKIGKLYQVEREIKLLSDDEKYKQRQVRSLPLLEDLRSWLDKNIAKTSKDGRTFKAMQYALNQWSTLTTYCEDGRINIANSAVENAIRPVAVGRRAWLFSDTPKGANASAVLYSLVESAKANKLEPYAYLLAVLKQLPNVETLEEMEALLPWNIEL